MFSRFVASRTILIIEGGLIGLKSVQLAETVTRTEAMNRGTDLKQTDTINKSEGVTITNV